MSSLSVVSQKRPEALGYAPIGEVLPMTLQAVIGGLDGILIATDTKQTGLPRGNLLPETDRYALELGKTRSSQFGTQKVFLNRDRTIAISCSGLEIVQDVCRGIAEKIDAVWDQHVGPIEALCNEEWRRASEDERELAVAWTENALLIAHSQRREAFKLVYAKDAGMIRIFHRIKSQRFVLLGGDLSNPAGMILERYLPPAPPPINRLAFLVAHYILMGGQLAPAGVGGLAMYFSKDGRSFEEVDEDTIERLQTWSEKLDKSLRRRLLKQVTSLGPRANESP